MEIGKLMLMVLAVVVFFVIAMAIFFPNSGLLPKTVSSTNFTGILDDAIGAKQTKSAGVTVPSEHLNAIKKLKERMLLMQKSDKNECFLSYKFGAGSDDGKNGFPELGEEGTSIVFTKESKGLRMTIMGGAEGLQEYSTEIIGDIIPCVISGGNVPKGFYDKFFLSSPTLGYWRQVSQIVIKYDDGGVTGFSENRISYDKGPFFDFEDGGYLFKKDKYVCFFPTNDQTSCDGSSSDGLGDNCLGETNMFSSIISQKDLWCK